LGWLRALPDDKRGYLTPTTVSLTIDNQQENPPLFRRRNSANSSQKGEDQACPEYIDRSSFSSAVKML